MSTQHTPGPWLVTYYNPGTKQRHTLIDDVDEATADKVVARFGENGEPYCCMPEVRKERAALAKATGSTTPGPKVHESPYDRKLARMTPLQRAKATGGTA